MELKFERLNLDNINDKILNEMAKIESQGDLKIKFSKIEMLFSLARLDYTLGCFEGDKLIGYIQLTHGYYSKNDLYVFNFMVDENFQSKGIGSQIFKQAYNDYIKNSNAEVISLDVEKTNRAISFYEKLGFEIIDAQSVNGANNYVMSVPLNRLKEKLDPQPSIDIAEHEEIL